MDDQFKNDKKETADPLKTPLLALIDEETIKKQEIARLEKKAAKKEKKLARKEEERIKVELRTEKEDRDLEKFRIVLERLQLNWIKWNVTCIALGFAAYKFYYSRVSEGKSPINYNITGRDIGIFLMTLGTLALLLATFQHKKNVEKLKMQYEKMPYSLSLRVAYIVIVFAIFLMSIVILRT